MSQIVNANEEYERARKRGQKEFALRRARGESGSWGMLCGAIPRLAIRNGR